MRHQTHWMRRALHLAHQWSSQTWPNPTVGACLVRDGELLAEGVHRAAGQDHAEVDALKAAAARGVNTAGATMVVTLEPCHHQGRTPPCTRALVEAGIRRVVVATPDPNPRVDGGGARWLAAQGVEVRWGPLADVARELNHPFFETGGGAGCHVTLKLALSADGRLARRRGPVSDPELRRISGERAHRRAHQLRARSGAILVGRRTVEFDRPRLDVRRVESAHRPRPVILDSQLALPAELIPAGSLVFAAPEAPRAAEEAAVARGTEVVRVPTTDQGLDWRAVLGELHGRGLGRLLVEGGAQVGQSLVAGGHVHRLHLFLAPMVLGEGGPGMGLPDLDHRFEAMRAHRLGDDVEWILRRR